MLDLFLAFLRIRTLIILGILYSFLSIGSHGNFSLKIPNLKNFDLSNISASISSLVGSGSSSSSKSTTNTTTKTNNSSDELGDLQNNVSDIAKNINNILDQKK